MDLPLYTTVSHCPLSDRSSAAYQLFDHAIVLKQVMRQSGQDSDQVLFRDILLRLRDAKLTISDWEHLMKDTHRSYRLGTIHQCPSSTPNT